MKKPSLQKSKTSSDSKQREDYLTKLNERIAQLEEHIERLSWLYFYELHHAQPGDAVGIKLLAQDRYVRSTSDGWLLVLISGVRTSIPAGLKVSLESSAGGRDYGSIQEGIYSGKKFDVSSGNLAASYRRVTNLRLEAKTRAAGPIEIGGVRYDIELILKFDEDGIAKTAGPYPATTDPSNPLPAGDHDVEIADFPHPGGAAYGSLGTVWFRIGHSGDRYLHPGRISAGCLTCAPGNWEQIYQIVNCARIDSTTAGKLKYTPAATLVAAERDSQGGSSVIN